MGPFDTEREAAALPKVRAIYAAAHADYDASPGPGKMDAHNRRLLREALAAAGIELGAYDERIAGWLSGWEPHVVAVIAGWVTRARAAELAEAKAALLSAYAAPAAVLDEDQAAVMLAALDEAAAWREMRGTSTCEACAQHPAELCEDHASDLDRADAYRALARRLASAVQTTCPVCEEDLSSHIGRKPCIQAWPSLARSLHDLPIFGWAWAEDVNGAER